MNRYLVSCKKFFSALTVIATVVMPYTAYVPAARATQEAPTCGTQTFTFSNEGSNDTVSVNVHSNNSQLDVSGANGWTVKKVWVDATGGGTNYVQVATGPIVNFNPDGISFIDKVKVEVFKSCPPPILKVKKVVVGSDESASSFAFTISQPGLPDLLASASASYVEYVLATKSYEVIENVAPGYGTTYSSDCDRDSASAGSVYFCTITNTLLPDLVVTKTSDKEVVQPGESFNWTIRIENVGSASAWFDDEDEIFRDHLPYGDDFANYSDPTVTTSGLSGTSAVYCDTFPAISDNENLYCWATEEHGNPDGLTIAPGGFIEIVVQVNLNDEAELGAITNPRRYGECSVDDRGHVTEANENNNDCSDTVYIGYEPARITVAKVADGTLQETDQFDFELRDGQTVLGTGSIVAPAPLATISFDVAFTSEEPISVTLSEVAMPLGWTYVAVTCELKDEDVQPSITYDGQAALFDVEPGDEISCMFVDERRGGGSSQKYGNLVVEKYIRSNATASFDEFMFEVDSLGQFGSNGYFDESGRNEFNNVPVGQYIVYENAPEGYTATYGDGCSETGEIEVPENETVTCRVINTADGWEEGDPEYTPSPTPEPEDEDEDNGGGGSSGNGTLIIQKVIWNNETGSASFEDFSFTVGSASYPFEEDGTNELSLAPGEYTVVELEAPGYTTSYEGDCEAVSILSGETYTCTITNMFGGVGGYNPEAEELGDEPTPSPTPGGGAPTGGSGAPGNSTLGGPDQDVDDSPSPAASPSEEPNMQAAASGPFLGLEVCSQAGEYTWWITLIVLAVALLLFGRRKGVYLWLIIIYAVVWVMWAWQICQFGYWWLPLLFAVIIWLLSVPRPGSQQAK